MTKAAKTPTPASAPAPDLDKVAGELKDSYSDDTSEFMLRLDRRQSNPAVGKRCPKGGAPLSKNDHGLLGVSAGAGYLVCGSLKCDYREGISRGDYEHMDRDGYLPGEKPAAELPDKTEELGQLAEV